MPDNLKTTEENIDFSLFVKRKILFSYAEFGNLVIHL